MTADFTTDNIDRLQALPLEGMGGWEISFRSANEGMHHQLYVNGRLADWIDLPHQRRFVLGPSAAPREVVVAAVGAAGRMTDWSALLPPAVRTPGWLFRAEVVRLPEHCRGSRLAVLTDHAAGQPHLPAGAQVDPRPLLVCDLWPEWMPRWGFGECPFAGGGFGLGGAGAPGMGSGAFGAGMFGVDSDLLRLAVELPEEGVHQVVLRTISPDGRVADRPPVQVCSTPPPAPASSLTATDYDPQTDALTLAWTTSGGPQT